MKKRLLIKVKQKITNNNYLPVIKIIIIIKINIKINNVNVETERNHEQQRCSLISGAVFRSARKYDKRRSVR